MGRIWRLFEASLLEWRNVPRPGGLSPAQLMFGRAQRTCIPRLAVAHDPIDMAKARNDREKRDRDMKKSFDRNAFMQPDLVKGDNVLCQDMLSHKWNRRGVIH